MRLLTSWPHVWGAGWLFAAITAPSNAENVPSAKSLKSMACKTETHAEASASLGGWRGCDDLATDVKICLSSGKPPQPLPVNNAVCGPQKPGLALGANVESISDLAKLNPCPLNACCNVWGQCGNSPEFCTPADSSTGNLGTWTPGKAGCISNCGREEDCIVWRLGYFANKTLNQRTNDILRDAMRPEKRDKFVSNLVDFVETTSIDGIHFDWANPKVCSQHHSVAGEGFDGVLYIATLKALRESLQDKYSISISVPSQYWLLKAFPVPGDDPDVPSNALASASLVPQQFVSRPWT
ncbi:hypothetical protein MRS44_013369 [Fusarium solani]|uniref:uncharacterized protein n=1 Tax=Fusarium solani TaxID=169388 RepID=UPI0032C3E0C6|nr:hypothetical protein MRS44_013369 [Fusarium solani]